MFTEIKNNALEFPTDTPGSGFHRVDQLLAINNNDFAQCIYEYESKAMFWPDSPGCCLC